MFRGIEGTPYSLRRLDSRSIPPFDRETAVAQAAKAAARLPLSEVEKQATLVAGNEAIGEALAEEITRKFSRSS